MNNPCPTAEIFAVLSKKHSLLVVYSLTSKELGFNELSETLKINTSTLTTRLTELTKMNIVEKKVCTEDSRFHYYGLTKKGRALSKLLDKMAEIHKSTPSG